MKLWSDSWANGERIPQRCAAGRSDATTGIAFSDNLNPHLAWADVPEGTRSYALICHDFDAPADLPRVDFFHWILVDLPSSRTAIAEGEFSRGFTPRGKPGPASLHGSRQGLNDFTGWFAGDTELAGNYFGYDGPFPPFNDSLVHHYVFTLYALAVQRAPVEGNFTGLQVREAIYEHVLAAATHSGTYTLSRRLIG
jgi:Raf kinase inhibitor-like YbhB/YbcL family protein